MSTKNSITIIKLASIVFLSSTMVMSVKYYESQEKNKKLELSNLLDKKNYVNELREILNRYDAEILKNKKLLTSISSLISNQEKSSAENSLATTITVRQKTIDIVKKPNTEIYLRQIDSLKLILKKQNEDYKTLSKELLVLINKNNELEREGQKKDNIILVSKNLTATNVYANGIKIISNNLIETKQFNKTEQIKVCFTLLENKATLKGKKDIYIQIINPKNKVISKNGDHMDIGEKSLFYSAKTDVYYDNDLLDVCVFVDPNKADILKGDYEINIFSGTNIIGNTIFSLK
jgi:hypothetical protein